MARRQVASPASGSEWASGWLAAREASQAKEARQAQPDQAHRGADTTSPPKASCEHQDHHPQRYVPSRIFQSKSCSTHTSTSDCTERHTCGRGTWILASISTPEKDGSSSTTNMAIDFLRQRHNSNQIYSLQLHSENDRHPDYVDSPSLERNSDRPTHPLRFLKPTPTCVDMLAVNLQPRPLHGV